MAKEGKIIASINKGQGQPAPARWLGPMDEMERLFDEFLSGGLGFPSRLRAPLGREMAGLEARAPRVDVLDRESEILVRAELPGVDKEHLDITVNENVVSLRATTSHEEKQEQGDYYRCEISRGSFARNVVLPTYVDSEKAKASFKDGILELSLPKLEQSKRRKIKVE